MDPTVKGAMIAAIVALIAVLITTILQLFTWWSANQRARKKEILGHRKDALFNALQVIDHVYANTGWDGGQPSNLHEWDINDARSAVNKMIVYCSNPDKTVSAFMDTIGLHNPSAQSAGTYGPEQLDKFRRLVCQELELPETNFTDNERTWIAQLPGATNNN